MFDNLVSKTYKRLIPIMGSKKMWIKLSRTASLLALLFTVVLFSSLPGRASAALSGNFGCLGNVVFSFLNSSNQQQTITNSQMMRLAISPTGSGTVTANIFFFLSGAEICHYPKATGTISVDPTGVGVLKLTFAPAVSDEDGDFACSLLFPGRSSVTENFHIVATKGNSEFFLLGKDDFITPSTKDNGDYFAVTGECKQQ